jgi:hypothetical protein
MPFETQDEPAQRAEICGAPARMPFEAWGKLRYKGGTNYRRYGRRMTTTRRCG